MNRSLTLRFWILLVLCSAALFGSETFEFTGRIADQSGSPLPGVEVQLQSSNENAITYSDDRGWFRFTIGPGQYKFRFTLQGFLTTELPSFDVPKKPLAPLAVTLPRLVLEKDLEVVATEPKKGPAPRIRLGLRADPPIRAGQPFRADLIIQNIGDEPIRIPTEPVPEEGDLDLGLLHMAVSLSSRLDEPLSYFRYYACGVESDCRLLEPGEVARIPVFLNRRVETGQRIPAVVERKGLFEVKALIQFTLPGPPPRRTEPVEQTFTVSVM